MPGSGKTTLLRQWVKEFVENNPNVKFDVLSFQFEMLGVDELAKDASSKTDISIKEIYSAQKSLDEKKLNKIREALDSMRDFPMSIVDNLGTVSQIRDTILTYCNDQQLAENKRGLVVTLDHSLLIKSEAKQDEKSKIDEFYHTLVQLKKYLSSVAGVNVIFLILHQLNRNIESYERVTNPKLHFPNKTDLFAASSVYYSSDYVIIIHRPVLIEGIDTWYGPPLKNGKPGLPVFNPLNKAQSMIYLHVIKERFGETRVLAMVDELKYSRIAELKVDLT